MRVKSKLLIGTLFVSIVVAIVINMVSTSNQVAFDTTHNNQNKIIKLKMAHNFPINSALHEASVLFAKKIAQKTNNQVEINIYPNQELGNDHQMVELAKEGEIDILLTPTAKMSVAIPSMQYPDLPFLFPTREDTYSLLDGEAGAMVLRDLDSIDLIGVTFWENGFKHFTANEPLVTLEDFKNKKMRVMKSRIIMEQFNALNAKPIPIDFHATKKALADKVVDGEENPLVAIVNMGFYEVQSDLILSEHGYLPYVFSLSKKSLSKLPLELHHTLVSTALEITPWEREETQKREKVFLDTIVKAGVAVHHLTAEEKTKFREKTKYIVKMYEDVIGSHIISKTEDILYQKYKTEDIVAIGVDVDLSMWSSSAGLDIKRGVELAVDEINQAGGLLGKEVVVIAKDHKAITTQGIKNIQEFTADPNIIAIIGGKQSAMIASEIKYIQNGEKPYLIPWAVANKLISNGYKENYLFRVSLNDEYLAKALLKESIHGDKKPIIIAENSIWGRGALENMKNYAHNHNIKIYDEVIVNRGNSDFSNIIKMLQKEKNLSVVMILDSIDGTNFIHSIANNNLKIPIISHWGIVEKEFISVNKPHLNTLDLKFIQTFNYIHPKNEKGVNLVTRYLKKYGKKSKEDISSPSGLAQAYDAVKLLSKAVQNANTFDGKAVKKALEELESYNGVVKNYKKPFGTFDHEAFDESDFFFAKYNKNGLIVPVREK